MLDGLILIILGVLAGASIVTAMVKNAEGVLKVLAPFQGYIGIVGFIWGVWGLIQVILSLGILLLVPIWFITILAIVVLELILGFIMGFGLISQWVLSGNEEAKKKGAEILGKLAPWQSTLGIIGILVGVWTIIMQITHIGLM